jgi:hypothetical protein
VADSPDPQRLGGLDWARRTGGRLTSRERNRLLAAIALGQWENLLGRAKLALGRLPAGARDVDLDTFTVPDSRFAREAEQACAELPDALVGHSYRTWLFGRALAAVDRRELDAELFYCGSLLHDHGIARPASGRDFALGSADRTLECARGAMVDGAGLRIWDVAPANVSEVLRRHPRVDFKRQLVAMIRAEAAAVPGGRFQLLVRCGLPLAVRIAPFDA